jgi:RNA polymerase sigma factor (sigma-70 family)
MQGEGKYEDKPVQDLLTDYFRTGNMAIMGVLYSQYRHLVFGMCLKYLRDKEMASEACAQIFEKIIEPLRKQVIHNFPGWLGFVTRNHCISLLREKQKNVLLREDIWPENLASEEESEVDFNPEKIRELIDRLGDEQRECVKLFFLDEKSYREISEQTGLSLKAVKSHLQNGKRNLKKLIENHENLPAK